MVACVTGPAVASEAHAEPEGRVAILPAVLFALVDAQGHIERIRVPRNAA